MVLVLMSSDGAHIQVPKPESTLVAQGRTVYGDYCITCHGETGGGIEEARLRFPDTHKICERCHLPSLPPTPQISGDSFSIGNPPALNNLRGSGAFVSREALFNFIRLSMPRWSPGLLSEDDYRDLSYYLWEDLGVGLEIDDSATSAGEGAP